MKQWLLVDRWIALKLSVTTIPERDLSTSLISLYTFSDGAEYLSIYVHVYTFSDGAEYLSIYVHVFTYKKGILKLDSKQVEM